MRAVILGCVVIWSLVILGNVWATKHGAPQQTWTYCDTLGWCAPKHLPYCPPDPKECG
jgi:hypothetical protein